jgi:hypothetical protein
VSELAANLRHLRTGVPVPVRDATTAVITTAHVLGLAGLVGVIVLRTADRCRRKTRVRAALAPADPVPVAKKVG